MRLAIQAAALTLYEAFQAINSSKNGLLKPAELYGAMDFFGIAGVNEMDIIDVFRRPQALPRHVPDILALQPLPRVVWFQQGIVNDAVAGVLRVAGIEVVQDRCTLADHRMLALPSR